MSLCARPRKISLYGRKGSIWQRSDTTYELDEFSSKCDVPAFSYIHLSPLMGTGEGWIFPHHHSCCLLQWEGITSAKHTHAPNQHILLAAERPCLPFSPGVLCSHCLTGWLIWPKFSLRTFQVHSFSVCAAAGVHPNGRKILPYLFFCLGFAGWGSGRWFHVTAENVWVVLKTSPGLD